MGGTWIGVLTHELELFWVKAHLLAPSIRDLGKRSRGLDHKRDGFSLLVLDPNLQRSCESVPPKTFLWFSIEACNNRGTEAAEQKRVCRTCDKTTGKIVACRNHSARRSPGALVLRLSPA